MQKQFSFHEKSTHALTKNLLNFWTAALDFKFSVFSSNYTQKFKSLNEAAFGTNFIKGKSIWLEYSKSWGGHNGPARIPVCH